MSIIHSKYRTPETPLGWIETFKARGFIILTNEVVQDTPVGLLSLSRVFGSVIHHELSDSDGVVTIEPNTSLSKYGEAFSCQSMPVHSDGAFLFESPCIVALQCMVVSKGGGENCIVDGKHLFEFLKRKYPDEYPALFDHDAMTMTRGDEASTRPIFSRSGSRIQVGFRLDRGVVVSFNPKVEVLVHEIQSFLGNPDNQILCP